MVLLRCECPDQGYGKSEPIAWEMTILTFPLSLETGVLSVAHTVMSRDIVDTPMEPSTCGIVHPDGCTSRPHSARRTRAVGVRAAICPGTAATRLAKTSAPSATSTTSGTGTVGNGMA